jgi:hypothetical protein
VIKARKVAQPQPPKTAEWFEHAVLNATPTIGILDGTDRGLWTLIEQSGILAGLWRQHRTQMCDLDIAAVSRSLGECLAAIVQCANVLDVSLESLMLQQIEHMHKASAEAPKVKFRAIPSTAKTPIPVPEQPAPAKRTRGRPKKHGEEASSGLQQREMPQSIEMKTPSSPSNEPEIPRKRGRPRKSSVPPLDIAPIAATRDMAAAPQRSKAPNSHTRQVSLNPVEVAAPEKRTPKTKRNPERTRS